MRRRRRRGGVGSRASCGGIRSGRGGAAIGGGATGAAHEPGVDASIQRHVTTQDDVNGHDDQIDLVGARDLLCAQRQTRAHEIENRALHQRVHVLEAAADRVDH